MSGCAPTVFSCFTHTFPLGFMSQTITENVICPLVWLSGFSSRSTSLCWKDASEISQDRSLDLSAQTSTLNKGVVNLRMIKRNGQQWGFLWARTLHIKTSVSRRTEEGWSERGRSEGWLMGQDWWQRRGGVRQCLPISTSLLTAVGLSVSSFQLSHHFLPRNHLLSSSHLLIRNGLDTVTNTEGPPPDPREPPKVHCTNPLLCQPVR
ncbi:uncharacterized protein LOC119022323 [Acanthopagrus latus]|uniref:uncharacterized protein LOC119022323 n=1 Tax=Acanthopagrus latus TaxID=8177 RepID=UPI00187CB4C9|nr:uncharacterized protein LOC119022323 [Acanthopagrus latus]